VAPSSACSDYPSISEDWQRAALGYALTNIATVAHTAGVAAALAGRSR
jgi:hypothetical protein